MAFIYYYLVSANLNWGISVIFITPAVLSMTLKDIIHGKVECEGDSSKSVMFLYVAKLVANLVVQGIMAYFVDFVKRTSYLNDLNSKNDKQALNDVVGFLNAGVCVMPIDSEGHIPKGSEPIFSNKEIDQFRELLKNSEVESSANNQLECVVHRPSNVKIDKEEGPDEEQMSRNVSMREPLHSH
jgi:hypothetical protein